VEENEPTREAHKELLFLSLTYITGVGKNIVLEDIFTAIK
jgi:hypothetical protein